MISSLLKDVFNIHPSHPVNGDNSVKFRNGPLKSSIFPLRKKSPKSNLLVADFKCFKVKFVFFLNKKITLTYSMLLSIKLRFSPCLPINTQATKQQLMLYFFICGLLCVGVLEVKHRATFHSLKQLESDSLEKCLEV